MAGTAAQEERAKWRANERTDEALSLLRDAIAVQRKPCDHSGIGKPGCCTCDPRIAAVLRDPTRHDGPGGNR